MSGNWKVKSENPLGPHQNRVVMVAAVAPSAEGLGSH